VGRGHAHQARSHWSVRLFVIATSEIAEAELRATLAAAR
jgi:hypothetical protein